MLIIILGCYNVDVGEVIDVLEVYVVSIFRFELCMGAGQELTAEAPARALVLGVAPDGNFGLFQ
jgi:hypothetical protein